MLAQCVILSTIIMEFQEILRLWTSIYIPLHRVWARLQLQTLSFRHRLPSSIHSTCTLLCLRPGHCISNSNTKAQHKTTTGISPQWTTTPTENGTCLLHPSNNRGQPQRHLPNPLHSDSLCTKMSHFRPQSLFIKTNSLQNRTRAEQIAVKQVDA